MHIAPARIRLQDFDHRVRHRPVVLVQHPARYDDALAQRLAIVLTGEIGHRRADELLPDIIARRPGDFGQRMGRADQRMGGRAHNRGFEIGEFGRWLRAGIVARIGHRVGHGLLPQIAWEGDTECDCPMQDQQG